MIFAETIIYIMQAITLELNPILTEEIKKDLKAIKQDAIELSLVVLIHLKGVVLKFLLSYSDYSISNIRKYGLMEILWARALKFFKLEVNQEEDEDPEEEGPGEGGRGRKVLKKVKRFFKNKLKIVLFPAYLLIVGIQLIYRRDDDEVQISEKKGKGNYYRA